MVGFDINRFCHFNLLQSLEGRRRERDAKKGSNTVKEREVQKLYTIRLQQKEKED